MRIAITSRRFSVAASLVLTAVLLLVPASAHGVPTTPEIQAKQAEAQAAQADLERMNNTLEIQVEEYNAITEALEQTRAEIVQTEDELACAREDLAASQMQLSSRAARMYKTGGVGTLDILLGVRSFDDFLSRMDVMRRINRADAQMVASVKEAKARVEATAAALQQRQAEQVTLQAQAETRANAIEADIAKQEQFVGALTADVRQLIAEEEARQRALAEERARQAAAAAAARRASSSAGSSGRSATDPGSLGAGHPEAVDIALKYLGVKYVYGGSSPAGFDCSGLTQYVYREIGISIPRTSRTQYTAGQHIAPDRLDLLRPGDLVFFGTGGDPGRIHHVGMYVGDGNFIHAPYTGTVVRIESLTARISRSGDYVGASRL